MPGTINKQKYKVQGKRLTSQGCLRHKLHVTNRFLCSACKYMYMLNQNKSTKVLKPQHRFEHINLINKTGINFDDGQEGEA